MTIIDAHIHCSGQENTADTLRALDEAQIDRAVLLAPFLSSGYSLHDADSLTRANAHLAQLVRGHTDRLVGFAVINPSHPRAAADLRHAVQDLGLVGCKMVPSRWYPYDDAVQETFACASELGLPLLFHSGIFIDGRSGRYCRPVFFEALREHPGTRVCLAHLGWPWTDEALALGLIDRLHGIRAGAAQFRFDLSFGAPPIYRHELLQRALSVLGGELLQFGSDCFLPCSGAQLIARQRDLQTLLDDLELSSATRQAIWSGTASAWLQRPERLPTAAPAAEPTESLR